MAEEIDRKAPGSAFVVERLLEVLCAELVRSHVESAPTAVPGWIRALKDPVVGRAIARLHRDPGRRWSVELLAREAAISPSRLAARFAGSLGMSPMAYLGRWRMDVACRMLSSTDRGVEEVGRSLGYESAAAFSRAFRKTVGAAPAVWRSLRRA
jgi:AraC-like DNA-binding protein